MPFKDIFNFRKNEKVRLVRKPAKLGLGDIVAGFSVAVIAIPQSMAYAMLAGMSPIQGLYVAIVPPIIAAFFVSSSYLQTGPVAITSILTLSVLSPLALPESSAYMGLAALLAIMIGIIRILIGKFQVGFVVYLVSQPVLTGFTTAAAIIIILTQLPAALGVLEPGGKNLLAGVNSALVHPQGWRVETILVTGMTALSIVGGRLLNSAFPGVLVAVIIGILYARYGAYGGALIGSIPVEFPSLWLYLPLPSWNELVLPAFVIALVGFAEPSAIARSLAARTREKWSANQEFVSQGAANVAAGAIGGFPVGGSFSRTMLNYKTGGRTRWSGAISGMAVLAFLPFTNVLAELPKAVLSGIVIFTIIDLIDFGGLYKIMQISRPQGVIALLTLGLTIALAPRVDVAVLIGIGVSITHHLFRERKVEIVSESQENTLYLQPIGVLYFGSAAALEDALNTELAAAPNASRLVLDLRKVGRIDYTGGIALINVLEEAQSTGLQIVIIPGKQPQGLKILDRLLEQSKLQKRPK